MRARTWIVAVTAGLAAGLAGCGADLEQDERQNLSILRELPAYPGAREVEVTTSAYSGEENGPLDATDGHLTLITYQAPAGTTAPELVRFFTSRLGAGWSCDVERVPDPQLGCTSRDGSISVSPDNLLAEPPRFEVGADHRGGPG